MTHPVENCHKYTAEQVDLRNLIYADTQFGYRGETDLKLVELQSLVTRGWMQEGDENNEFDVTDAGRDVIAATLRQQAERGDGAVSAWREEWAGSDPGRGWYIRESTGINGRVVAYLGENITSELVREVIAAHNASLFIGKPEECADACPPQQVCDYCQAVAPLLRAPAEQGGRVIHALEEAWFAICDALSEVDPDWMLHGAEGVEAAVAKIRELAALAQNAQGEAKLVAWMTDGGRVINAETRERVLADAELGGEYVAAAKAAEQYRIPLFHPHAERARVPDDALNILRRCRDSEDFAPLYRQAMRDAVGQLEAFNMLAAPSQPEDAEPEEVATVECKKCGGNGGWGRLYSGPSHLPSEQCPDCEGEGTVPATIQPEDAA